MKYENGVPAATRGDFSLGRFTIHYSPLREGPRAMEGMWTRFEIWFENKIIGSQLSRPSESDCEYALAQRRQEKA